MLFFLLACVKTSGSFNEGTAVDPMVVTPLPSIPSWFRLILVGDTGKVGPLPKFIADAIAEEVASDVAKRTYVLALGDLFYPNPPAGEGCVDAVVERYKSYYGNLPVDRVFAVAGNHDVFDGKEEKLSEPARACTEAAFQKMGWLKPGEPLQSRQVVIRDDTGTVPFSIEIDLIEAGFFSEEHPEVPAFSPAATWQLIATHYVLGASFGKGLDEQGQFYGMPKGMVSDLWINGHAHHLESRMVENRLAITSGGGAEFRPVGGFQADLYQKTPSFYTYARCPDDATCADQMAKGQLPPGLLPKESQTGGYVVLDFSTANPDTFVMGPVVCNTENDCIQQPSFLCQKVPEGRGVLCSPR